MTLVPPTLLTVQATTPPRNALSRTAVVVLAVILTARTVWCVASLSGINWDFANYQATGSRIVRGEWQELYRLSAQRMDDYYSVVGGRPADRAAQEHSGRMGHIGFPLSSLFFAPLGYLEPREALLAFKLQSAFFLAAAAYLLYRPFRTAVRNTIASNWILPAYLLICLLYAPFWFVFAVGGQATPLNLFLLVLFHRAYVHGYPVHAGLLLAAGMLIKPFFVLTLPVFVLAREWRVLFASAGWVAVFGAVSLLLFGLQVHLDWVGVMRAAGGGMAEPWWNNCSVLGAVYSFWCVAHHGNLSTAGEPTGPVVPVLSWAYKLVVLGLFVWLVRLSDRIGLTAEQRRQNIAILAILFALLFSGITWPHYLAFLFVPLVFLLTSTADEPGLGARVLPWLILVSTLSVQSRFAQRAALTILEGEAYFQAGVAGLFGSCTLILTLVFLVANYRRVIRAQSHQPSPDIPVFPESSVKASAQWSDSHLPRPC